MSQDKAAWISILSLLQTENQLKPVNEDNFSESLSVTQA